MAIIKKQDEKGVSIIEILVVIIIVAVAFTGLLDLMTFSLKNSTLIKETAQANNLTQEAIEAVRNFRDGTTWDTNGLGSLTTGVSYFVGKTSDIPPKWELVLGEETINNFTRKIVFSSVKRDADDNIVESGGATDSNTRKIMVTVSWKGKKVEIITYLTNWKK